MSRLNYLSLDDRINVIDIDALYIGTSSVSPRSNIIEIKPGFTALFLISDDPVEVFDENDF